MSGRSPSHFSKSEVMHTAASWGLVLAAIASTLSACSDPDGRDPLGAGLVRTDSAGIEILTSGSPAWKGEESWQVNPVPALEIGSLDGPEGEVFHEIVRVQRAGDDVLVSEKTELRFFDSLGQVARTLGGRGEGPGEFEWIISTLVCDERIVVSEVMRMHITVFDGGGTPSTIPIPPPERPGDLSPVSLRACSPEGIVGTLPGAVVLVREEEVGLDTLLAFPGTQIHRGLIVPFGGGSRVAIQDNLIYRIDTRVPEVRLFGLDGSLRRILRFPLESRSVTDEDIERIRGQYLDVRYDSLREEIEQLLNEVTIPSTMPLFSQLKLAPDGTVWLRAYQPFEDEEENLWFAVESTGLFLGSVDLPSGFSVHEFGSRDVLGVWTDEYDVEYVRRYVFEH